MPNLDNELTSTEMAVVSGTETKERQSRAQSVRIHSGQLSPTISQKDLRKVSVRGRSEAPRDKYVQ